MTTPENGGAAAERASTVEIHTRKLALAAPTPESVNEAERTIDAVVSAGSPVARSDWRDGDYIETLSMDPKSVRLDRLNRGAPMIDSHNYWGGTQAILGAVVPGSARLEDGELRTKIKFSRSAEGERAFQDARDGVLRFLSVGYLTHKFEVDDTTSPPTRNATDWEPHEVSAVAIPADPQAGFRSAHPPIHRAPPVIEERKMPDNAPAPGNPAAAQTDPVLEARALETARAQNAADISKAVEAAVEAEQGRRDAIIDAARKLGLPPEFGEQHIKARTPLADFRIAVIDEAAKIDRSRPTEGQNVDLYAPNPHVIRGGIKRDPEKGEMAGRFLRAVAAGKRLGMSPVDVAGRIWGDELTARTLSASIAATGGFLVPEIYSDEVIDLLRPRTVVRSAGARSLPMPQGNTNLARLNGGSTATYVGENMAAATGDPSFGQIRLSARKLMARVGVSNDLLRFASPAADAIVRDDMVKQLAVAEDRAFLRGAGSQFSPKGIRYSVSAANILSMTPSFTVSTAASDMTSLVTALENALCSMIKPTWFFNQRTKNFFYDARDSVGGFLYREEMDKGLFRGFPFKWTQNIPQNLTVSAVANTTEVYLVDMDEFFIADVPGLIIDASQEATYTPDGVTLVSAFDNDQTVLRVIEQHDCALRHDGSAAVLTGVTWQ